jgi:hypothetical protein
MRRPLFVLLLAALASMPWALSASAWFEDVPPCHWAAAAVAEVAELGIFIGFPSDGAYDSVNALRQVFEGLRCGDASWSLRFMQGAPARFGLAPAADLTGFALETTLLEMHDDRAIVSFALTAVVAEAGVERTEARSGTVTLRSDGHGWRVAYGELAGLDLALFP